MVKLGTLNVLVELEREMASAGRSIEEQALREAVQALARTEPAFLTTGRAAARLRVSVPTVKRWVERGVLAGGSLGNRWVVAAESVERLARVREALVALDDEGNPTPAEISALYARSRRSPEERDAGTSGA